MNELRAIILSEIDRSGCISFARFMELALYYPGLGYYETEAGRVGRSGDFCTSVSVGCLFGELLAFQFALWLEELAAHGTAPLHLIEVGAHDGQLVADILGWLRKHRPTLAERIDYCILEPSERRRAWQGEQLGALVPRVKWFAGWSAIEETGIDGIIFSNELHDAFPVRRARWDATGQRWAEWGVTRRDDGFIWCQLPEDAPSPVMPPDWAGLCPELAAVLPDGYSIEVGMEAAGWWGEAASRLRRGKLLTIDYGLTVDEVFVPHRRDGTLRAYHRHRVSSDLLADAGEQDLTSHVNFTSLQTAGVLAGLEKGELQTQAKFLTRIAGLTGSASSTFGEWTPSRRRQFQTLTHPDHLGRSFKVFVQSR